MACEICQADVGLHWCNKSKCPICHDCALKLEKCPKCKCKMAVTHFLAGKINSLDSYTYCHNNDNQGEKLYQVNDRRLVASKDDISHGFVNSPKAGAINAKNTDIIPREVFMNPLQNLPPPVKLNNCAHLSGPSIILNKNLEVQHACWSCCEEDQIEHIADSEDMMNRVNQRNNEMIENCDAFTLTLNDKLDCFRSIAEWGIALIMGKILILNIEIPVEEAGEFYLFACDSLHSLKSLSFQRKEAILRSHPLMRCSYKHYKQQMERLIKSKQKRTVGISRVYEDYEQDIVNE